MRWTFTATDAHTPTQYAAYCSEVPSISDLLESFNMLFFIGYEKEQFHASSCAVYSSIVGLFFYFATPCQVAFSCETILWWTGSGAFPRAARQKALLIWKQCAQFCHGCWTGRTFPQNIVNWASGCFKPTYHHSTGESQDHVLKSNQNFENFQTKRS